MSESCGKDLIIPKVVLIFCNIQLCAITKFSFSTFGSLVSSPVLLYQITFKIKELDWKFI